MKISKIKKLITARKYLYMATDIHGRQWIGDGAATFLVEGMPPMVSAQMLKFLDIPNEKAAEIDVENNGEIFEEAETYENASFRHIVIADDELRINGYEIAVLTDDEGHTVFINPDYLKPTEGNERKIVIYDRYAVTYDGVFITSIIRLLDLTEPVKTRIREIYSALG